MFELDSDDEEHDGSQVETPLEGQLGEQDVVLNINDDDSQLDCVGTKRKRRSSTSLEDLRNKNKLDARAVSSSSQPSKKKDFSTTYADSTREQLAFQQVKLTFEKEAKDVEFQLKREELEQRRKERNEELEQRRKERDEELEQRRKERDEELEQRRKEREEDQATSAKERKGMMIEKLAATGKSVDEIKAYLELFDQL